MKTRTTEGVKSNWRSGHTLSKPLGNLSYFTNNLAIKNGCFSM